jgi:shikimate dehydrogenase
MEIKQIPRSIFGLLGERLDYSFSRAYFSEKFERLKLNDHEYRNYEVSRASELVRFRESVTYNPLSRTTNNKSEVLRGLNVTIPYKEAIMEILDEISPDAQTVGAVNTIVIEDNKWIGHNTDAYGFGKSLAQFLPFDNKALILGTGGASKAIAYVLESMQIPYLYVSRNPQDEYTISYDQIDKELLKNITLIVNTTPVGTFPNNDECPKIPYNLLDKSHVLYDLVYNPSQTLFMKKGNQQGALVTNGYQMLVHQAERAWKLWNE